MSLLSVTASRVGAPLRAHSRTFAKAAAAKKTDDSAHQPLIKLFGIPARYANAAYSAASKTNSLDKVEAELLSIRASAEKSEALKSFFMNPTLSRDAKSKEVEALLGGKMSDVTMNVMTTLAGNARLDETTKVVDAYEKLMKAKRGEVDAVITSAAPLTKAQQDSITAALKAQAGKGKNVSLSTVVNPDILGGIQVSIGDQFLDLSASSKINEFAGLLNK